MIQKLGKYTIIEKLGEGAMGAVYKGYDEILDRYVAIKTMAEDIKWNQELKLRFYREARSAASLHHPNIVIIHELGEEGKIAYIVMELLEGKDLKDVIKDRRPLTLEQKLSIFAQICEGLNHAHLAGIIHRDIKPGNIHFSANGVVKIVDFGIAHIPTSDLTQSGVRLGTPIYMSPEQIRGEAYDGHSDMFSAGIVWYELLTNVHPFRDKNITKTLDNILFQANLPFAEQYPDAPQGLWPILRTCLEKDPGKRYRTMAEAGRACRSLLADVETVAIRMANDLNFALPRLRQTAAHPDAPPRVAGLFQEAQTLLDRDEKPDYASLQRLLSALAEESWLLQTLPVSVAAAPPPPPPDPAQVAAAEAQRQALAEAEAERAREASRAEAIASLLAQSRASLGQWNLDAAVANAREVLDLDPDNAEAKDLLKAADQAHEEKRKQDQIEVALARAREALEHQDFPAATACCNEALAVDPGHSGARNLLSAIAQAEERKRRDDQITRLMAEGQQAAQRDDLTGAEKIARQALELDPQQGRAADLLLQINENRQRKKKAEISAIVASGRQALGRAEFQEATRLGEKALAMDPESIEARNLRAAITQAQEDLRQEEIAGALERGRKAWENGDFEEAERLADVVANLDSGNKAATVLRKDIKRGRAEREKREAKERKSFEKEARRVEKGKTASAGAGNMEATVLLDRVAAPGKPAGGGMSKVLLWGGIAVVVLVLGAVLVGKFAVFHRPPDLGAQVAEAQSHLDRGLYEEAIAAAQGVLSASPGHPQAQAILASAQKQKGQKEISTLLMEAQNLRSQGKFQESLDTLSKLLAIDSANEAALSVRSQIESEIAATKSNEEQDATAKTWLANAGNFLAAGKLAEAKAELDKVARIRPDAPELKAMRRQLTSRNEDLARLEKQQKSDTTQKQKMTEDLGIQAEMLFEQGKYGEAYKIAEQWLAAAAQNTRAMTLQRQTQQALQHLKAFEALLAGKSYDEALAAVAQLEKINPRDPGLAEMRKRVEERMASAKAILSVFRLGRPCKLILDGAVIGAEGELENRSISVGRHKLVIENDGGKQVGNNLDYTDGQTIAFVYDAATMELRPMVETDRALLARRKTLEQVVTYEVEHRHVFGKCTGTLVISGLKVEYRASEKSHSFQKALSSLKLTAKAGDDKVEVQSTEGGQGTSSWTFKVRNAAQAAEIKELWDRLQKLAK